MSRDECIMHYKAALAVFKKWFDGGIITAEDFTIISTKTAQKYGIDSTSIFFEIAPEPVDLLSI